MKGFVESLESAYLGAIIIIGLAWVVDVPRFFGLSLISPEWIGLVLAIGVAAAFLRYPYGKRAGVLDVSLGLAAIVGWCRMSFGFSDWIIDIAGDTPAKFVPGAVAIVLLMEALRKAAGLPIALLVWGLVAYGAFGYLFPQPFQAEQLELPRLIMYLYADTNGVPGLVLSVVGRLVLVFIIFGRLMQVSGATKFFTDLAMAAIGRRRGGSAKVAVVASSIFGSINGTSVGNILSTGIVTIPLMKRTGFKPHHAAAIEAVASNGGQFAPPVMGATAFLVAEFLQIPYTELIWAAAVPAVLYYVCLLYQVDAIALRDGLRGLPEDELADARSGIRNGWVFLAPVGLLLYLLFWHRFDPAMAALWAIGALLVLATMRARRLPRTQRCVEVLVGCGSSVLPLLMIAGGAGVVIGVMNVTGLGFSLSISLGQIAESGGTLTMLLVTAGIAIVLGMGMTTAAIYVLLSVILAPSIVELGIPPLSAHLFIFYFGLLSFLTPPVAIASFVAAELAQSGLWRTSWAGVQLAVAAYLLPFLWVYNDALLLQGSVLANFYAVTTALVAVVLIASAAQTGVDGKKHALAARGLLFAVGLAVGSSTIWLGNEAPLTLVVAAVGAMTLLGRRVRFFTRH
jgi:TRAP transporter 4TM/12TM fusion protein